AVPLPTLFSAAAFAFAAASPVAVFSASSCLAVPCAGKLAGGCGRDCDCVVDPLCVVVVPLCELAAPAIAEPPRASAASPATMTSVFLTLLNMCPSPFRCPGCPGFKGHGRRAAWGAGSSSLRIWQDRAADCTE